MITCDNCGQPLHTDEASILWNNEYRDKKYIVTAFIIVHNRCDDGLYLNSAGAPYGRNWNPDLHGGSELQQRAHFSIPDDKRRYDELIAQRRKDYRPDEPPPEML